MESTEDSRRKMVNSYAWVKRVIESSETQDHLAVCRNLVENWSLSASGNIRDYKCPFYKTKGIRKTIESYIRAKRDLNIAIADKSVSLSSDRY